MFVHKLLLSVSTADQERQHISAEEFRLVIAVVAAAVAGPVDGMTAGQVHEFLESTMIYMHVAQIGGVTSLLDSPKRHHG
jgi:hypothetical protein